MQNGLIVLVLAALCLGMVAQPACAGPVERVPLSAEQHESYQLQEETIDANIQDISAGAESTTVWAAVGVTLIVLIIIGAAAGSGA